MIYGIAAIFFSIFIMGHGLNIAVPMIGIPQAISLVFRYIAVNIFLLTFIIVCLVDLLECAVSAHAHANDIDPIGIENKTFLHPIQDIVQFQCVPRPTWILWSHDDSIDVASH